MYKLEELISIAKRENNIKRNYLIVNKFQGKHVPVNPQDTFCLFEDLSNILKGKYLKENILIIGFAETATAIGTYLAVKLNTYYIQTTRENIDKAQYLFFSETHSHAVQQKIVKNHIDGIINKIDRIIFAEDEITTGNTILNAINKINETYGKKLKFSVISILNAMNNDNIKEYSKRKIDIYYILKINNEKYSEIAEKYCADGKYVSADENDYKINVNYTEFKNRVDTRCLTTGSEIIDSFEKFYHEWKNKFDFEKNKKILILGTEEFMFLPLYIGSKLKNAGCDVKCHATTRSPIDVSQSTDYILNSRYELVSLYDDNRKTFIYNLDKYDRVYIITDAYSLSRKGLNTIINALCTCGNKDIDVIRWC